MQDADDHVIHIQDLDQTDEFGSLKNWLVKEGLAWVKIKEIRLRIGGSKMKVAKVRRPQVWSRSRAWRLCKSFDYRRVAKMPKKSVF